MKLAVLLIGERLDGTRVDDALVVAKRLGNGVPATYYENKFTTAQMAIDYPCTELNAARTLPLQFFPRSYGPQSEPIRCVRGKPQPPVEKCQAQRGSFWHSVQLLRFDTKRE